MKIAKLIYFRHGKSLYTGKAHDITEEGEDQVVGAVWEILGLRMMSMKNANITCSPQPRAINTASLVVKGLNLQCNVEVDDDLRCADLFTDFGRTLPWPLLPGEVSVEQAYIDHSRFEEGVHFEKRSNVKKRFSNHLAAQIRRFSLGEMPDPCIRISHYEVLHHLVKPFEFRAPLTYAELIVIDLMQGDERFPDKDSIHVTVKFRGRMRYFEIPKPYTSVHGFFEG